MAAETATTETVNILPDLSVIDPAVGDKNMTSFWQEVVSVWHDGFMGVDIGKILIALMIFTAFLILRGLLSKYILHTIIFGQKNQKQILMTK